MLIEAPHRTLRRVLLCAAVLGWATRAGAEPDGSEARAYTELFAALTQATDEIDTNIARIGNRSQLFGPDIDQFRRAVGWMRRTNAEGLSLVARAGQATDPAVRRASLAGASARMEALILATRAIGLQVSFVIVGDAAENAGQVSTTVVAILAEVGRKTRPVVDAAVSLDRARMESAAREHGREMDELRAVLLPRWIAACELGVEWSRKAILVGDGFTLAVGAYEAYGAIRAAGGGPGIHFTFPGIGGAAGGGVAVGSAVTISAEVLESIRQLIRLGAISNTVLSAGLGPSASMPELVGGGVLLFKTPVGTITPAAGPFKGQRVEYGDSSHKHTNVAGYTLEELKEALRRPHPPKNKLLRTFVEAVRARSTSYGSQLSREAVERYEQLVKQALEKGVQKNGGIVCEDVAEVGIDVTTGKATRHYQLNGAPGQAHIFPASG